VSGAPRQLHGSFGDQYLIQSELGRGAMATVYLAQDLKHGRSVALKVFRPEAAASLGAARFLQEIRFAARLAHPHIMPVYDSGRVAASAGEDDLLFYVMPYLEGESLRHRLARETRLPTAAALRIAREVADAIDYAHRQGIIHRDVKPENILLEDGHAVLADFGIARGAAAGGPQLTEPHSSVGTPMYMSPEQAGGKSDIDGRSDLYSLGCVLYEMLSGRFPFDGPDAQAILVQRLVGPPPRLEEVAPEFAGLLDALVAQAMATDPADRFASAAEFSAALSRVEQGSLPRSLSPAGQPMVLASIAVLPFLSLSADKDNEFFSEGITDEIINALAQVQGLRVAARSSSAGFKGSHVSPKEIGERLKVRTILEGSVRKAGDRVRITAQLINAADGYHLWSQTYERTISDVFAVQDELARAIAATLTQSSSSNPRVPLVEAPTENLDAYAWYLRGRHFWTSGTPEGFRTSVACFEQALALDQGYAEAHAWLAYGLAVLAFDEFGLFPPLEILPKARAAANRALELQEKLADAHFARALVAFLYEWDWDLAREEFERAVSLPSPSAFVQHWYAIFLCAMGRPEQGLQVAYRAEVLDPLSPTVQTTVGRCLHYCGREDEAIERYHRHLALNRNSLQGYVSLSRSHLVRQSLEDGLAEVERGINVLGRVPLLLAFAGAFHARLGRRAEALALLRELRQERSHRYVPVMYDTVVLGALGELDELLQVLERGYQARSGWLPFLRADQSWNLLRADPRFFSLLRHVGLDS
jgi:serine/threonine protein kinase/Tfp pilus assembly protein PilF